MRNAISTDGAPRPAAPFAQGIETGTTVYVSGQLGIDPETGEIPGEVGAETRRLLENMRAVVEAAGLTMDDVVKTTIFMTDFDDYVAMNEAYAEFLVAPHPARSTVKVAGLLGDARVEIEAIAVRRG